MPSFFEPFFSLFLLLLLLFEPFFPDFDDRESVGIVDGNSDGVYVGDFVGILAGALVGVFVGAFVGRVVGASVRSSDGLCVPGMPKFGQFSILGNTRFVLFGGIIYTKEAKHKITINGEIH